jgi:hypothetical protein
MQDTETKTLWNHITGEAMYGELIGRKLPVSNLPQTNVKQALAMDPNLAVAISSRPFFAAAQRMAPSNPDAALSDRFIETLGTEDTRRPRMDMGLGVWSGTLRRYYPMELIRQRGGAFFDVIDQKKVLIYIDPESSTPAALFVDARGAKFQGKELHLDDGTSLRVGVLDGRDGRQRSFERPQQIFTRWYGFALTFPGCEVFGQ